MERVEWGVEGCVAGGVEGGVIDVGGGIFFFLADFLSPLPPPPLPSPPLALPSGVCVTAAMAAECEAVRFILCNRTSLYQW